MHAIKNLARYVWQGLFIVVITPILWILEPFVRIRLGYISNQRIGHLSINTEAFIRCNTIRGWPARTVFLFTTADPANRQLLEMYKRHLNIFESRFLSHVFFACRELLKESRFYQSVTWSFEDQTVENISSFSKPIETVSFTAEEERRGRALLERMGLGPDDWFACFHARDNAYFLDWRPELAAHWEKTTFRNANIEDFRPAMECVTGHGGHALRVGAVVDAPFDNHGNARIIDYASDHRSDFGDIYVLAKNRFFLASNSGIINVPLVFNKPVAVANMSPLSGVMYRSYDLFIPKLIRRRKTGAFIDFKEALALGFFDRHREMDTEAIYTAEGLEPVDNTPEQISAMCRDMMRQVDGIALAPEMRELQLEFQRRYHNYLGVDKGLGFLSPTFAIEHKHLIVPD